MTAPLSISLLARTTTPFLCGFVAVFVLVTPSWLQGELLKLTGMNPILIEAGVFILICLLGCALVPTNPFRAANTGIAGVFVGSIAEIIAHPTIDGFERNLFPLEIALHTLIAALSFLPVALAWKVAYSFSSHGKNDA
jgi:hypothetical protein